MIFGTDWPGIPGIAANARAVAKVMPDEDTTAAVLALQRDPRLPRLSNRLRHDGDVSGTLERTKGAGKP